MKQPPPPEIAPQDGAPTEKTGPPQPPNHVADKGLLSLPLSRPMGKALTAAPGAHRGAAILTPRPIVSPSLSSTTSPIRLPIANPKLKTVKAVTAMRNVCL
jgi:hypothetical protein